MASDMKEGQPPSEHLLKSPAISLPKGGGAIRGIGEKFAANPVTGTGSMSVPIAVSPGRSGFGPQLALSYDSGAGNGPFGLGWSLSMPSIARTTDKGLPRYVDAQESDVFILSGAEELVPLLSPNQANEWVSDHSEPRTIGGTAYHIQLYRPRVEGLFARIERWTNAGKPSDIFWRTITKDNITSWYGRDNHSRIYDPESIDPESSDPHNPTRIFSWLICMSYDGKGNVMTYQYKQEDGTNVDLQQAHERNRGNGGDSRRTANRYIKRIRYGNHVPWIPKLVEDQPWPEQPADDQWYFEVVFDYGEHDQDNPAPEETKHWVPRPDPFSTYRPAFEMRNYRLCQRVLMFHHFPDDPHAPADAKGYDGLVRSTELTYEYEKDASSRRAPVYTKLAEVAQRVYERRQNGDYRSRQFPPLQFTYSDAVIQTEVRELDDESLENLPTGIDGALYQWIDLDGEGLPGVLTEQADAWFYKRNLSPIHSDGILEDTHVAAKLAPLELVWSKPAASLAGRAQFLDLAGDGRPDLVQWASETPGFYERTTDGQWTSFTPIAALPHVDWSDPNLKFIDVTGDGHADILISEHGAFVWYPSLGEEGFGSARRVSKHWDEEKGPHMVFADCDEFIYLADMSGDGLSDIVRITKCGTVSYWPNLGYGRFGSKVTMDHALQLDSFDQFDPKRIRLADIDGSGTTDILYLSHDGVHVYFNHSGNSWSDATIISAFPKLDHLADVQALDLLGNGTACLVWSSRLPGDARSSLRYMDLMGGQKPHLLTKTANHLGLETSVTYAPSTKFYLQDKQEGKPWITKLPFPVHCVEKVTVRDQWRNTAFSSTYRYHHGYYDGHDREFRGFGRVDQIDTEEFGTFAAGNIDSPYITDDLTLYQPPVQTVTWFHTGVYLDQRDVLGHYKDEYFPTWLEKERQGKRVLGTFRENELPEPDLDAADLTADEWREAFRACKGMMLRQEVYELDVDSWADHIHKPVKLFTAANHNCHIHRVQPKAANPHAVFHVTESEAVTYHYELDLQPDELTPDPRVVHTLNLSTDQYGNIQQAITVVYPRHGKFTDEDHLLRDDATDLIRRVQLEMHMSYIETYYTNDIPRIDPARPDKDNYRLRLPYEAMTYELTGADFQAGVGSSFRYLTLKELRDYMLSENYQDSGTAVTAIPYHQMPDGIALQKRLVEHTRTLYFDTTLDKPLPLGRMNELALPYENYKLALTDVLLELVHDDRFKPNVQEALADMSISGYLSGDKLHERFGIQASGQYWMCSGIAGFHDDASAHFYLPERYIDPFGYTTTLSYDNRDLYIQASTDVMGNRTEVTKFDYRLLTPRQMKDPNGNMSEVIYDILGMPAAMAVMGKGAEADHLSGLEEDDNLLNPDLESMQHWFVQDDYDDAAARQWLSSASARHLYYFGETLDENGQLLWGQHPPCACGIVRERHYADVPDSPVQCVWEYSDGAGSVIVKKVQAEPEDPGGPLRWVASGKTILNNKGKPVKQYEPYFCQAATGHRFEEPAEIGVTPVMYYDALGRLIRTESPDGAYSRAEFTPWYQKQFDANDTVLETGNAWYKRKSALTASVEERRAARMATDHANTPSVIVLDSLGREVVSIVHNRVGPSDALADEKYVTFTRLDAEGKPLWIQDSRGNRVMQYVTPAQPEGSYLFHDERNFILQGFVPSYDITGNILYQHSMDAGDRWMLNDAAGKPMFAWNSRGFITRFQYDKLHRPICSFVTGADPVDPLREIQFEKWIYGEQWPDADERRERNLCGMLMEHYDTAGAVITDAYDFKGNPLHTLQKLTADYKAVPDWAHDPPLEAEHFVARTRYDALNRPSQWIVPYSTANPQRIHTIQPLFNEAGLLDRVDVWLNQTAEPTALLDPDMADQHVVTNLEYNAKGQRLRIQYGNGTDTIYEYEESTFRVRRLRTTRATRASGGEVVQDLRYTYDPVGNIMQIRDEANDRVFHSNQCVRPGSEYRYDALYRLIAATGREHRGNGGQYDWDDGSRRGSAILNDCTDLQNYVETYLYDEVGNIMQMLHHSGRNLEQPGQVLWNRRYQYAADSNRLLATRLPGDPADLPKYLAADADEADYYSAKYGYDLHGSMASMPHLPQMNWDFKDQLSSTTGTVMNGDPIPERVPSTTYYVYDSAGMRVRKVTETQSGALHKQRIYLGGFELYREYEGDGVVVLERESLHVMDDKLRVALIETQTIDDGSAVAALKPLVRYQLGNHLGSACLELDQNAAVITYEEYTPYGSTAYCAGRSAVEVNLKRYGFTGKERDDETGFNYHGARYYASWLGRWVSCDPIGIGDGSNIYRYGRNNPVAFIDTSGSNSVLNLLMEDERERVEKERIEQANDPYNTAGVTIDEVKDAMSLKNGDMIAKYGWNRRLQIFDAMERMSPKDLAKALPPQDHTVYLQPSGRQATDAQERATVVAEKLENFNPGTPIGGVARTVAYAAGASPETVDHVGAIADQAESLLPVVSAGVANAKRAKPQGGTSKPASKPTTQQVTAPTEKGRGVWELGSVARGRVIESELELPGKKINGSFDDFDRAVYGPEGPDAPVAEVGQTKSLDFMTKGYTKNPRRIYTTLMKRIGEVAAIGEGVWEKGGNKVVVGTDTKRVFDVAIPPEAMTNEQAEQFDLLTEDANELGVETRMHRVR
ncbi:toxin [Paenibacillus sp. H1-7]|uniref:SpvB/TcaC N-terminal domain-containing protein n=1 Tax=Paenibacillus sp. H1-7 TaxID=2282849 RepID=UPI001EF902D4|nr:SpvB/TcaC N-terminal domain-containing protein [Paenibacillus sp. H1-7]ULL16718.1 toxin [Paenibacillus sp. H1-7]